MKVEVKTNHNPNTPQIGPFGAEVEKVENGFKVTSFTLLQPLQPYTVTVKGKKVNTYYDASTKTLIKN